MLEILNPCNNPNAWWQQLIMLAGPLILGYLWAKGGTNSEETDELSARLTGLDTDLAACKSKTNTIEASLKAASNLVVIDAGTDNKINFSKTDTSFVGNNEANKVASNSFSDNSNIKTNKKDDLKVVEGIGPKIEELFNNAGIFSYEQLAGTSSERLKEILLSAGSRYQMHDPATWPAQSKLAAEGKWEELKKWQDNLNKGLA